MADMIADVDIHTEPHKRKRVDADGTDKRCKTQQPTGPTMAERLHSHMQDNPQFLGRADGLSDGTEFKLITKLDGNKGALPKTTKWVLQGPHGRQFTLVGRSMFHRMSARQAAQTSTFQSPTSPVDVSLCLSTADDDIDDVNAVWPRYQHNLEAFRTNAQNILEQAVRAVTDLVLDDTVDTIPGVDKSRRAKWAKQSSKPDKVRASVEDQWNSTLHSKDYFTIKKRNYDFKLERLQELVAAQESGTITPDDKTELDAIGRACRVEIIDHDESNIGDTVWTDDHVALNHGDVVMPFFEIIAQCAAGSMHLGAHLKSLVILRRKGSGDGEAGGGGLMAALKAIA